MRATVLSMGLGVLVGASAALAGPTSYALTDLGPIFDFDLPQINSSGQVALSRTNGTFIWSNGVFTPVPLGPPQSRLLGLNDLGDASGYFLYNTPAAYIDGAPVNLSPVVQGALAHAAGINDARRIVLNRSSTDTCYVYDHASGQSVQLLGEWVEGRHINNSDEVVGSARSPVTGVSVPFHWVKGTMTLLAPPNIDGGGAASAINDVGTLVGGYEDIFNNTQPFLRYANGEYQLLPLVPATNLTSTLGINDATQVVGFVRRTVGGFRAVLWDDGVAVTLTEAVDMPGWTLEKATDINDAGQIVGVAEVDGVARAFMLTPVPGPGTTLISLVLLGAAVKRRR